MTKQITAELASKMQKVLDSDNVFVRKNFTGDRKYIIKYKGAELEVWHMYEWAAENMVMQTAIDLDPNYDGEL